MKISARASVGKLEDRRRKTEDRRRKTEVRSRKLEVLQKITYKTNHQLSVIHF
ncbi:MAG: hypothetical protein PHW92_01565 [Lutibacter sp.]|nr:hypothetical protein [Lutibacter sp.]